MDYTALVSKLAQANLPINAHLHGVMDKVKVAGLHTTAARLHDLPEFTAKTAVAHLGTQLVKSHYRYQKIAAGLALLPGEPATLSSVKEANFLKNLFAKTKEVGAQGFKEGVRPAGTAASRGIAGLEAMGKVDPNFSPDARHVFDTLGAYGRARRVATEAAKNLEVPATVRFPSTQGANNPNFQKYLQGTNTPEALAAQSRAQLLAGKART
jgi:hypothetical protein